MEEYRNTVDRESLQFKEIPLDDLNTPNVDVDLDREQQNNNEEDELQN